MLRRTWCHAGLVLGFGLTLTANMALADEPRAQEGDEEPETEEVIETEEVVVIATKTPVPVKELTSSVEVITGEQLQQRKIKTVIDALRLSQGTAVFSSGGPGTLGTVRIRGGTPEQTLVILDGAIMNDAGNGQFNFANLTTDNIEKIEILRGSQSMVWGADAMGGVVSITTKRGRGTPTASGFLEYGSFVSIREGAAFSGQQGPLDFSAGLSRWDFTGFSAVNYRRGAIERDAYRNWQASTQLGLALPKDGRLDFKFRWLNGDTNLDNGSFDPGFDVFKAKTTSVQFVYSGSYKQPITDWWEQILTASRQTLDRKVENGTLNRNVSTGQVTPVFFGNTTDNFDTAANRIEWQHNFTVGKPLLLTLGYQFREQLGETTGNFFAPEKIISSNSGFSEAQLNLWDRVFATAGVRQDEYNAFPSATTWRVTGGYLHKETGTKIRSSYGTGYRVPTVDQLFRPGFGNPNLKPEKSQSWDIGLDQSLLNNRVNLSATYFWNRFRGLIQNIQSLSICGEDPFLPPGSGVAAFCPFNLGKARAEGWELGFNYLWSGNYPLLKSLNVKGQYTYTFTRDLINNTFLAQWPQHQASAVLGYRPIDQLLLSLEFRFVGAKFGQPRNRQPLNSFTVYNLAADYDVNKFVQVYTRVDNLFDEDYEEVLRFGTPIRSIYGGVRVNFDVPLKSS